MLKQKTKEEEFKSLWLENGVWRFSELIREFRNLALKKRPFVKWTPKAKEPQDPDTIAQNLTYLFPSHLLKMSRALSTILSDNESVQFLTNTGEITILDLACGVGTAGIGVVDFIVQLLGNNMIERNAPLTINVILNDIQENCVKEARSNFSLLGEMIPKFTGKLRIGVVETCNDSISNVLRFMKGESKIGKFHCMVMAHPFDPILYHADNALDHNPECADPLALARPCDRPGILGDFFVKLGAYADPYFSRALLVQENRYSPLLPVCLPSNNLKVIRTNMEQEAMRPDCTTATMIVPFAYCAFKYSYSAEAFSLYPFPQPLPHMEDMRNCFEEKPEEAENVGGPKRKGAGLTLFQIFAGEKS